MSVYPRAINSTEALNEFLYDLSRHEWSFETIETIELDDTNPLETYTRLDRERSMLNYAQRKGDAFVRNFCAKLLLRVKRLLEDAKRRSNEENMAFITWNVLPDELRQFHRDLYKHDWLYRESDDPQSYAAGAAKEKELEQRASQGGELYMALWNRYVEHRAQCIAGAFIKQSA